MDKIVEYNEDNLLTEDEVITHLQNKLSRLFFNYEAKCAKIQDLSSQGFTVGENISIPSYIILPTSTKKIVWDFVIYSFTLYHLFFIPIDIGFGKDCLFMQNTYNIYKAVDIIMTIVFFVDILLTFVTAIYNTKGQLIYTLRVLASNYIGIDLILDIISLIPFQLFQTAEKCDDSSNVGSKLFLFFGLIRFRKIVNFNNLIEKSNTKYIILFRLTKLLVFFYYFCHFFGCAIVGNTSLIGKLSSFLTIDNNLKDFENFMKIYSYSLLVGITLLMNTDQQLMDPGQEIIIAALNIIALAIAANIFGYIALILEKINSSNVTNSQTIRDRTDLLTEYMLYENIDEDLRNDVVQYCKFMYIRQRMLFTNDEIYTDLNPILLAHVKFELWKKTYFVKDRLFSMDLISPMFITRALEVMEGRIYKNDETIIEQGEHSMDFYLVCTASICEVSCSGLLMAILKEGDYFGDTSVFTSSKKRLATVTSKSDGDYIIIPGNKFYELLLDFEDERNFFNQRAVKQLALFNQIITPDQFSIFLTNKDKIYSSLLVKNLFINAKTQNDRLFLERYLVYNY